MKIMTSLSAIALAAALTTTPLTAHADTDFVFGSLSASLNDNITIFVSENGDLSGVAADINDATDGRLQTALEDADFKGKMGKKKHFYGLAPYKLITVIGTGDKALEMRDLRDLGGHAAQASDNSTDLSIVIDGLNTSEDAAAAQIAMGYRLGSYNFDKYKSDKKDNVDRTVALHSTEARASERLYETDLSYVVDGVEFARDMGSEPGNAIYPETFVEEMRKAFRGINSVKFDIMDAPEIRRNGMGALMGVGKGSINDPRLVVMTYNGGDRNDPPIALIGKGITFDTGGISLKPNNGMWAMKSDLSGAAAVTGTMLSIAQRGEDVNLVGIVALAENMPSQDATRPGDILTAMDGTTIEIFSTDAEGRLVMSDALLYAQKEFDPKLILNIATLTGSAARAVGDDYGVVVTRDWELTRNMMDIGKMSGEDVWPLPLNENHKKALKSDFADLRNTGISGPGASTAAAFVGSFVEEDVPWVHLDIAGVDWLNSSRPTTPKGHAGWGVRFMDQMIRESVGE
jgi:leucyl aminopeptidase